MNRCPSQIHCLLSSKTIFAVMDSVKSNYVLGRKRKKKVIQMCCKIGKNQ